MIEAIERTFGGVPEKLALDTRFVRPLPVGSSIRAGGILRDAAAGTYDIFLRDMNDFAAVNAVYAEFLREPFPARATVQVARLPRDVAVEIDGVAVLGDADGAR